MQNMKFWYAKCEILVHAKYEILVWFALRLGLVAHAYRCGLPTSEVDFLVWSPYLKLYSCILALDS